MKHENCLNTNNMETEMSNERFMASDVPLSYNTHTN